MAKIESIIKVKKVLRSLLKNKEECEEINKTTGDIILHFQEFSKPAIHSFSLLRCV
jgi:hypothetical protein